MTRRTGSTSLCFCKAVVTLFSFQIGSILDVHCENGFRREVTERCLWDVKLSKETCSSSGINEQESDIFLAGNLTTFSSLSVYSPRRQEPGPAAGL